MGISTHSTQKAFVIFSNQKVTHTDKGLSTKLHDTSCLKQYEPLIKAIQGVWHGVTEPSFLLPITNQSQAWFNNLLTVVFDNFQQDCILICTNHKHGLYKASLIHKDGTTEDIGYLRSVREDIAKQQECYSIIDGNYYIVTDHDKTAICDLEALGLI